MSGQAERLAHGRCVGCGRDGVAGELVNEVETNSAPFWANVRCPGCAGRQLRLSPAPSGFHVRRG
jgi:hypothetical protein